MTFEELDEMWHKIREENYEATKHLSPEERAARAAEEAKRLAKKYGLTFAKRKGSNR